jgi:hypothetical protein
MTDTEIIVEDESDLDIEIVDETPPEDKDKPLLPEDQEDEGEPDPEELAAYSEKVRKRIERLTFEKHDQRRKREAAEREVQKAVEFSRMALNRIREYEAAMSQVEQFGVDQAKSSLEVRIAQAKADIKEALESADGEALAKAQEELARLVPQHEQYSRYQPRQQYEEQQYIAPPPPQQQAPDPKFVDFVKRNPWFQTEEDMTKFALGLHAYYEKFNPQAIGTDEYYRDIESEVKKVYGAKAGAVAAKNPPPSGPNPTRNGSVSKTSAPRKSVTLTADEVRLIKRLGITPQQYAAEKLKEMSQ